MNRRSARAPWLPVVALIISQPAVAADLLVNGGFDEVPLGTGWTQMPVDPSYPIIVTSLELPLGVAPHSGTAVVWLGGFLNSSDAIHQDIDVPLETAGLTLSGYRWIATEETGSPFDHLYVEVLAPNDSVLEVLGHWTNLDLTGSWVPFSLEATGEYAGMSIRIRFRSINDESLNTNFWIDTCRLDASPVVGVEASLPAVSRLVSQSPNPTRGTARWRLDLTFPGEVDAGVYDVRGRLVHRIAAEFFATGSHELAWSGSDVRGGKVPSGVYICLVKVGGQTFSQTIVLIR